MSERIDRKVAFTWNGAAITGVLERGIKINGTAIDVTTAEDDGIRTLLSEAAESSWDITLAGVRKEITTTWNSDRTQAVTMTYPDGATISGNFYVYAVRSDIYGDDATFQASLRSSGVITYVSAAKSDQEPPEQHDRSGDGEL